MKSVKDWTVIYFCKKVSNSQPYLNASKPTLEFKFETELIISLNMAIESLHYYR